MEIFNEFSLLCGFANQHQKFILYLLKMTNNDKKNEICMKIIEFLVKKNYNIGTEIFKEIINIIKEEDIINKIPKILIVKNIPYSIKKLALFHLYKLIKLYNDDKLLNILKCFKYFIDWIKIPDNLLEYLINLLKKDINNKIYKEIIYFLGNYFSIKKINQEKYLDEILLLIKEKEIYQYILNNVKIIKEKNEIFYLFSSLNYSDFSPNNNMKEEDIIKIPTDNIINYIDENKKEIDDKILMENIEFLNGYWQFESFSPKRDQTLRKLFYNDDPNAIKNLKLICC